MDANVIYIVAALVVVVSVWTCAEYSLELDFQKECKEKYAGIVDTLWEGKYSTNLKAELLNWGLDDSTPDVVKIQRADIITGATFHALYKEADEMLFEQLGVRMKGDHYVYCKGLKL